MFYLDSDTTDELEKELICQDVIKWASKHGCTTLVKLAIKAGACPSIDDDYPIIQASKNGYRYIVKKLIKAGADPRADDDSPIILASEHNHLYVVKELIKAGADPNSQRCLALRMAIHTKSKHVVIFLLEHGVDIDENDLMDEIFDCRCDYLIGAYIKHEIAKKGKDYTHEALFTKICKSQSSSSNHWMSAFLKCVNTDISSNPHYFYCDGVGYIINADNPNIHDYEGCPIYCTDAVKVDHDEIKEVLIKLKNKYSSKSAMSKVN